MENQVSSYRKVIISRIRGVNLINEDEGVEGEFLWEGMSALRFVLWYGLAGRERVDGVDPIEGEG